MMQQPDTNKQEQEVEKKTWACEWRYTDAVSRVMTSKHILWRFPRPHSRHVHFPTNSCSPQKMHVWDHSKSWGVKQDYTASLCCWWALPFSSTLSVILSFAPRSSKSSSLLVANSPRPPPCSNAVLAFSKWEPWFLHELRITCGWKWQVTHSGPRIVTINTNAATTPIRIPWT